VHLGLADEEFYALTPRQHHVLVDQHLERTEHAELLAGTIAAAVANWSMGAPKKPMCAADFMPSRQGRERKEPSKRLNRKKIAAGIRAFLEDQRTGR
jgi:hypothetical protein